MMDGFMNLLIHHLECFMQSFNELELLIFMTSIEMVLQKLRSVDSKEVSVYQSFMRGPYILKYIFKSDF